MRTIQLHILIFLLIPLVTHGQQNVNPLYVFVGERISIEQFEQEVEDGVILMDLAFRAKYKVLENIYSRIPHDTIEFIAFDHYGTPSFSHNKYVLLYLTRVDTQFYHCKYLYSNLYKTKDGEWAGIYPGQDYNHRSNQKTKIKPVKIIWSEPVTIDVSQLHKTDRNKYFPQKYFNIENDSATAIYGNYIPELFELKRNGFLKARGYFE